MPVTFVKSKSSASPNFRVPLDNLIGKVIATNLYDEDSGEVVANANDEITPELS